MGARHEAREDFARLIAGRNIRLSLNGAGTWRGTGSGYCYLHADGVFVGAVHRTIHVVLWSVDPEKPGLIEDGGMWAATLQARRIPKSVPGIPRCYPYSVGDRYMSMWDALNSLLLEHDWRTGATARVGRRRLKSK